MNPQIQESGKYRGHASISKKGNSRLRKAAYQAAVCSVKTQSFFSAFYKRLRAKGKPAKVALVALAHKILCTALAVVKQQKTYREDFHRLEQGFPEEPLK
ncbi:transposase [Deinococcus cellulosilyticus]|uniref:transposase n=1 Tax=Deinococcus cellulosilyticus TaxID=401558 RepID=UPI0035314020